MNNLIANPYKELEEKYKPKNSSWENLSDKIETYIHFLRLR